MAITGLSGLNADAAVRPQLLSLDVCNCVSMYVCTAATAILTTVPIFDDLACFCVGSLRFTFKKLHFCMEFV